MEFRSGLKGSLCGQRTMSREIWPHFPHRRMVIISREKYNKIILNILSNMEGKKKKEKEKERKERK